MRDAGEYFDDIPNVKLPKDMLDLARHIVETKSGHFKPQEFEDHYEHALKDLIEKKAKGEKIEAPKEQPTGKVINLMDALSAPFRRKAANPHAPPHRAPLPPRAARDRRPERNAAADLGEEGRARSRPRRTAQAGAI